MTLHNSKKLVIIRTTGDRYFYDDRRIEAEYDHKHICSHAISTVEDATNFLKDHNCNLINDGIRELTLAIRQDAASCKIHIDIASDVVYASMYTILQDDE